MADSQSTIIPQQGSGNLPAPPADGAILVGANGQWQAGIDKDPKGNSFQAADEVSTTNVNSEALDLQNVGSTSAVSATYESIIISDSSSGNTVEVSPDGILAGFNLLDQDTIAGIVAGAPTAVDPVAKVSDLNGNGLPPEAIDPELALKCSLAYIETANEASFQIDSTQKQILIGWVQEGNERLSRLSLRRSACVAVQEFGGNLYAATGYGGDPTGGSLKALGLNVELGAGWSDVTVSGPPMLDDGKAYCLVLSGSAGIDASIGYNRNNTSATSALPDNCWAKYSTDGGATWLPLTKDSRNALFEFVLNSTVNHCPQLAYVPRNGIYVPLFDDAVGSWVLRPTSGQGYYLDCEALTADTFHYAYFYEESEGNFLLEASTTGYTTQDARKVKIGEPNKLYVGAIEPITRQPGFQAPIDVMQRRLVDNVYNQSRKTLGKLNPYIALTTMTCPGYNVKWRKWNLNDDWKVDFVLAKQRVVHLVTGGAYGGNIGTTLSFSDDPTPAEDTWPSNDYDKMLINVDYDYSQFYEVNRELSQGYHSAQPYASACGGDATLEFYPNPGYAKHVAAITGHIGD
ncbi:MAG: hypothetical protein HY913_04470 [Desulfomonile tiedjei]|nr:hypothetical protein [Desulfomonile tiedjei]